MSGGTGGSGAGAGGGSGGGSGGGGTGGGSGEAAAQQHYQIPAGLTSRRRQLPSCAAKLRSWKAV